MGQYRYDTHVHTSEVSQCGKVNAATVVELYKEAGYYGIVITDHYKKEYFDSLGNIPWEEKIDMYLSGYNIARSKGEKIGLKVILGMELKFKFSCNEYLVYGIDEALLKENPELYEMGLSRFSRFAASHNLLIYQAHPYRTGMKTAKPEFLTGVEVFNGNPRHNSRNQKSFAYAKRHDLRMISGSDFHQLPDLARGGIEIPEEASNSIEFVKILKNNSIKLIITE